MVIVRQWQHIIHQRLTLLSLKGTYFVMSRMSLCTPSIPLLLTMTMNSASIGVSRLLMISILAVYHLCLATQKIIVKILNCMNETKVSYLVLNQRRSIFTNLIINSTVFISCGVAYGFWCGFRVWGLANVILNPNTLTLPETLRLYP